MAEVAPRIRRLGDEIVGSYLVEDGGGVTIVDAGAPAYWNLLDSELAAMGRTMADLRAVVLTHGHDDHIGFAERARTSAGVPVRIHALDVPLARREQRNPAHVAGGMRPGATLRFLLWSLTHGLGRSPAVQVLEPFQDGSTLDVPGSPRVVHVPGHTPGSVALDFTGHDALFVGDSLNTYAVTTGRDGPQLSPFNADRPTALASLARLESLDASVVLPGHGAAFWGSPAEAVRRAREREAAG